MLYKGKKPISFLSLNASRLKTKIWYSTNSPNSNRIIILPKTCCCLSLWWKKVNCQWLRAALWSPGVHFFNISVGITSCKWLHLTRKDPDVQTVPATVREGFAVSARTFLLKTNCCAASYNDFTPLQHVSPYLTFYYLHATFGRKDVTEPPLNLPPPNITVVK